MTFDEDGTFEAPARNRKPRKPVASSGSKSRKTKRRRQVDKAKIARIAGIGMTAAIGLGIVVNALMMQTARHPAPLFAHHVTLAPAETAPKPAHVVSAARAAPEPDPTPTAALPPPRPVRDTRAAATPATTTPAGDPIGQLLRTGTAPATGGETSDAKTVLGVQRALMKLGYVVKPNGSMGPVTRKALQAFEKERHLPATGEVNRRVVKILAAESGVRID